MYRTLLVSTMMLGALASAQNPAPAPASGSNGYPAYPAYEFPCSSSFDIELFYGFEGTDHKQSLDIGGAEITSALYFTPRQAVTFSLLIGGGEEDDCYWYEGRPYRSEFRRSDLSLMAGYRFSQPLGRVATVTCGIKGGLDVQFVDLKDYADYPHAPWDDQDYDADGTSCGFGYAAYTRVGFQVSPYTQFTVGYQFRGATTAPTAKDDRYNESLKTKAAIWHEVHMGLEVRF